MATRDPGSGNVGSDRSKATGGTMGDGASSGSNGSSSARSSGGAAGGELRDHTRRLGQQAKERVQSYADERKQAAASQVGSVAEALRSAADKLGEQDQGYVADYVRQAADGLERVSSTLRERDLKALATQAQDLARQQPALLIAGAATAGFLLARFAKASASGRESGRMTAGMSASGRYESGATSGSSGAYGASGYRGATGGAGGGSSAYGSGGTAGEPGGAAGPSGSGGSSGTAKPTEGGTR